jgi:hypothetical protein
MSRARLGKEEDGAGDEGAVEGSKAVRMSMLLISESSRRSGPERGN